MRNQPIYGYGLCQCGCGERTKIAPKNRSETGWIKGQPMRFIHGHQSWKPVRWIEEDRGYETPCWIWQLAVAKSGYALSRGGAHRRLYEQFVGPVPEGLQLDHLCRVRECVNPEHLEPVTPAENQRRGAASKLTLADVAIIRERLAANESCASIAADFPVTKGAIKAIRLGRTWVAK